MYSISKLTISGKIPTFQLGEVLALFWRHHHPKGLRRDRLLMYLIFIHSWTDCPSLFFVQLWCTRVSSETCRQSFKDCTLEQLGVFSLLPLFGSTVGIYFDHLFLFSFSRISLITGIILRCSEWESSTSFTRYQTLWNRDWRNTFSMPGPIPMVSTWIWWDVYQIQG